MLTIDVEAMSMIDRSIDDLLNHSFSVVEGAVVGLEASCVESGGCKSRVVVRIDKSYKGHGDFGEQVEFCSFAPLTPGFRYVFFLEQVSNGAGEYQGCGSVAQRDGVFSRFDRSVYRYMSPGSLVSTRIEGVDYLTGWVEVAGFDDLLGAGRSD